MVEDGVQNHAHTARMQGGDGIGEILVGSQAAIDPAQVARVVAVGVGGEDGVEQNRADTEFPEVGGPVYELTDAMALDLPLHPGGVGEARRVERATEHAQGVDLVEGGIEDPHGDSYLLVVCSVLSSPPGFDGPACDTRRA